MMHMDWKYKQAQQYVLHMNTLQQRMHFKPQSLPVYGGAGVGMEAGNKNKRNKQIREGLQWIRDVNVAWTEDKV